MALARARAGRRASSPRCAPRTSPRANKPASGCTDRASIPRVAAVAQQLAPGPPGHFFLGNIPEISRDQLGFLYECARRYGDAVELHFGSRPVVVLNNPHDVEEVLVTQHRNFAKGYF